MAERCFRMQAQPQVKAGVVFPPRAWHLYVKKPEQKVGDLKQCGELSPDWGWAKQPKLIKRFIRFQAFNDYTYFLKKKIHF